MDDILIVIYTILTCLNIFYVILIWILVKMNKKLVRYNIELLERIEVPKDEMANR